MMVSLTVGARHQCFPPPRVQLVLLHLKIWTLLVHLFDLIRALQERLFFLIGGVYLLRGHNIPYYWYCQCVCHSTTITSFMGLGKHGIAYFWTVTLFHHGNYPFDCATVDKNFFFTKSENKFPERENAKRPSIKEKIKLMKPKHESTVIWCFW